MSASDHLASAEGTGWLAGENIGFFRRLAVISVSARDAFHHKPSAWWIRQARASKAAHLPTTRPAEWRRYPMWYLINAMAARDWDLEIMAAAKQAAIGSPCPYCGEIMTASGKHGVQFEGPDATRPWDWDEIIICCGDCNRNKGCGGQPPAGGFPERWDCLIWWLWRRGGGKVERVRQIAPSKPAEILGRRS